MRKASLKAVAEPAGISASYLQKLERDLVKEPSPRILQRLATQLDLPYRSLMELAGYVVPAGEPATGSRTRGGGALSYALSSEDLTEDEAAALTAYLNILRQQKRGSHAP
jgi:transcriptional regulator with XRE-family HTH domain